MEITIHLAFGWPWLAFFASLVWLILVVPIGNVIQQEWWFNVLILSLLLPICLLCFAVGSTVLGPLL